jgi:hypothetical protein
VLRDDNVLHIESVVLRPFGGEVTLDNFIIDNIVVFYKTKTRFRTPLDVLRLGTAGVR